MKIAIATIFYNNCDELKRLFDSIPDKAIDWFIGIDGIFKYTKEQHPELPDLSNDGSRQLILGEKGPAERITTQAVTLVNNANTTEFEKRNRYLEICQEIRDNIDCLIITDTDEYFIYPPGKNPIDCWNHLRKNIEIEMIQNANHNVYGIRYLEGDADTYKPRIWVNPAKMRYVNGSHYHYANIETEKDTLETFKQNRINYVQNAAKILRGGVTMTHDHSLRSQDYQKRREEYQKYLVRYEELTQSYKFTQEECHQMAKANPDTDWEPTSFKY
jgi:hypothetical protein